MKNSWQEVPLKEVAIPITRSIPVEAGIEYRTIGVKWWGMGAYERETIDGSRTAAKTLSIVREGDLIINKIWVRHGSVAIANKDVDGCAGSGEFPTFELDLNRIEPKWIHWQTKMKSFWRKCDSLSQGTSGKNRIKPELFLTIKIPLPLLDEQRRILEHIEALATHLTSISQIQNAQLTDIRNLLVSTFKRVIENARWLPMRDVAPLIRRHVEIDASIDYPELGIRSFGRGTFHKPAISGVMLGTKRLFRIEPRDLIFSNVFAWEGAVAVAKYEDVDRFGSHRFITCLPIDKLATSDFLCFYFLTKEGLEKLGAASPGGAGRNRTLGLNALENILVPVPEYDKQVWFDSVQARLASLRELQSATGEILSALLPSVLDKAFKGEL